MRAAARAAIVLLLLLLLVSLAASGCAAHMGKEASSRALDDFEKRVAAEPGQKPVEAIAGRAAKGAVNELAAPEQMKQIQAVASAAGDSLRDALVDGLTRDLGPSGDGPLGRSLSATLKRASTEAVQGAMTALLAVCDPADPSCVDRRLGELGDRFAVGFTDGVKRSIGVPALIAAFVAGAGATLLALAIWTILRRARPGGRKAEARLPPTSSAARV